MDTGRKEWEPERQRGKREGERVCVRERERERREGVVCDGIFMNDSALTSLESA